MLPRHVCKFEKLGGCVGKRRSVSRSLTHSMYSIKSLSKILFPNKILKRYKHLWHLVFSLSVPELSCNYTWRFVSILSIYRILELGKKLKNYLLNIRKGAHKSDLTLAPPFVICRTRDTNYLNCWSLGFFICSINKINNAYWGKSCKIKWNKIKINIM